MRSAWPVLALVALAYLSAFWSDAPDLVLRRATTLAITTLFAIYLIVRFDLGRLVAMLVKFNALAVVGSFAVAAVAHHLAVCGSIDYPTAWRGVYTAKNTLGGMSAFGILVAVYALRHGYGSRLIAAAVIPGNIALLYLSQSATPLMLLLGDRLCRGRRQRLSPAQRRRVRDRLRPGGDRDARDRADRGRMGRCA